MYPPQRAPLPLPPTGVNGDIQRRASLKPIRFTATVPARVYEDLVRLSGEEGRSISNLAAYLLEMALHLWRQRQRESRPDATRLQRP